MRVKVTHTQVLRRTLKYCLRKQSAGSSDKFAPGPVGDAEGFTRLQTPRRQKMLLVVRIRKVEEKKNTTQYELLGDSVSTKELYVNTQAVSSLSFDTEEMLLTLSSEPFADGVAPRVSPKGSTAPSTSPGARYERARLSLL